MKKHPSILFIVLLLFVRLGICQSTEQDHSIPPQKVDKSIPQDVQQADPTQRYDVVVVGSGAAGSMAALRAVLNNDKVLFVIGAKQEQRRSRGTWVPELSNLPMFSEIKRPMFHFRNQIIDYVKASPQRNKLFVLEDSILNIVRMDAENEFLVMDSTGTAYRSQTVILVTGMMDEQPQIQGSIQPIFKFANTQQIIYCLLCDGHLSVGKNAVAVIGHTSSAANNAIILAERYAPPQLSILTNGEKATWDAQQQKLLDLYQVKVYEPAILEIADAETEILSHFALADKTQVPAELAVVSLGVRVNNELAKKLGAQLDDKGFVITDEKGQSSVPNLFIAGDLRANTMKQVYSGWYTAVLAANAANEKIRLSHREKLLSSEDVD